MCQNVLFLLHADAKRQKNDSDTNIQQRYKHTKSKLFVTSTRCSASSFVILVKLNNTITMR